MRRSRPLFVAAFAAMAIASVASAQRHSTPWVFAASSLSVPALGRVDARGGITTIVGNMQLPTSTWPQGGTMDIANRNYAFVTVSTTQNGTLYRVDPSGQVLKSLQILPTGSRTGGGYTLDVIIDSDGEYLVAVGGGFGAQQPVPAVLRVDSTMTRITTVWGGAPLFGPDALVLDVVTGDILVLDIRNRIVRVAQDGTSATPVGQFQVSTPNQIALDARTGTVYKGGYGAANATVLRMDRAGAVTTFLRYPFAAVFALGADRSSAANPRLMVGSVSTTSGIYSVDVRTKSVTTLLPAMSTNFLKVFPDQGRNIHTIKTGAGRWNIGLHFPGQRGNAYQLALSLSGVVPGFGLPDGRHVGLNFDAFTGPSLRGQLGPILTGQTGVLSATDRGQAVLDVSAVPGVTGLRVYLACVTFNPNAPLGIRTVAEPWVVVL